MKFEIKNLKIAEFASEETICFECSVYVDGKRAFTARNDGHGGPNYYYPTTEANAAILADAMDWALAQPKIYCADLDFEYQPDLDHFIGEIITAEMMRRDRMKAFKKGVAFIEDPENDPEHIVWYPLPKGTKGFQRQRIREKWEPQIMAKHPTAHLIAADGSLKAPKEAE